MVIDPSLFGLSMNDLDAGIGGYSLQTLGLLALGMSLSIALSAPTKAYQPMDAVAPDSPLPKDYDIDAVAAHYERRPLTTLRRGSAVPAAAMQFGIGYLLDSATGALSRCLADAINNACVSGYLQLFHSCHICQAELAARLPRAACLLIRWSAAPSRCISHCVAPRCSLVLVGLRHWYTQTLHAAVEDCHGD